jgi:hypothetical protein
MTMHNLMQIYPLTAIEEFMLAMDLQFVSATQNQDRIAKANLRDAAATNVKSASKYLCSAVPLAAPYSR